MTARLVHTSARSMHVAVRVRAGDSRTAVRRLATQCMSVLVRRDKTGRAAPVPPFVSRTEEDHRLDAHARALIEARAALPQLGLVAL